MMEVYTNYNRLEKGQNSSCKEITEETNNCAIGGKYLSKRLVCLKNRIRINAENLIILLGTSAAAIPSLDCYMCFWSFFVKRDTQRQEGKEKDKESGTAVGKIHKRDCKGCNCVFCNKDK